MQSDYTGTYRAIVTSNVDPTGRGFIKVQCPQVAGLAELNFAEPANRDDPIPRVGDQVWIYFNGGETHKPIYTVSVNPYTWQTAPAYRTGWSSNNQFSGLGGPSLRFRLTLDDCLFLYGNLKYTTGGNNFIFDLPTGYFNPDADGGMASTITRNRAGTITVDSFAIDISGGACIVASAPATGDEYILNTRIPLLSKP